jgi:hypothetical protein
MIVAILVLFTSINTPFRIAFDDNVEKLAWNVIDQITDALFMLDIIINFFMAYYDINDELVTDRKIIALNYLKSWFFIDLTSVLPLSYFINTTDYTSLARITRLPKLYRLIKMTKLARVIKIFKERSTLSKYLNDILNLNVEIEKTGFFVVIFMILCHVVSCFWVIIVNMEDRNPNTWIIRSGLADATNG